MNINIHGVYDCHPDTFKARTVTERLPACTINPF